MKRSSLLRHRNLLAVFILIHLLLIIRKAQIIAPGITSWSNFSIFLSYATRNLLACFVGNLINFFVCFVVTSYAMYAMCHKPKQFKIIHRTIYYLGTTLINFKCVLLYKLAIMLCLKPNPILTYILISQVYIGFTIAYIYDCALINSNNFFCIAQFKRSPYVFMKITFMTIKDSIIDRFSIIMFYIAGDNISDMPTNNAYQLINLGDLSSTERNVLLYNILHCCAFLAMTIILKRISSRINIKKID